MSKTEKIEQSFFEKEILPTEGLAREIVGEARQFVERIADLLE